MLATRVAAGDTSVVRRREAPAVHGGLQSAPGQAPARLDPHAVLQLQTAVGNIRVAALLQRCGTGRCACGGACRHEDEGLPLDERFGGSLRRSVRPTLRRRPAAGVARLPERGRTVRIATLQRAPVITDSLRLEADLWKGNTRLQSAFHNNPTLTARDAAADVALLQEALDTVFRGMPKSKKIQGGVVVFDGIWGKETFGTVHDYQVAKTISPPGGFEAGRRTLGALDAELRARQPRPPAPTPTPPAPRPSPPLKVCGPNVGAELVKAWTSAQTRFRALSFSQKLDNCRMLVQPLIPDPSGGGGLTLNQDAFDTWGLFQGSAGWTRVPPWHGSCGSPGSTGALKNNFDPAHEDPTKCSNTVQIGSDCWLTGTPNYGLFGIAMRECSDFTDPLTALPGFSALHDLFSLPSTIALVGGYKLLKGDNIVGPEKWAIATWLGGPSATTSGGNRPSCGTTCAGPPPPPFSIVWAPHMPRPSVGDVPFGVAPYIN